MKRILFLVLLLVATTGVYGQKFAVKSNLLYDATATINLGVEVGLAKKWSLDLSGNYNGWKFGDEARMKHWLVQPEARYWLCEKFNGHFFGLHAHYADYNVGGLKFLSKNMENHRYQGNLYGAGLSYGYQWLLSDRWSMEAVLGIGWAHLDYDKYPCATCGTVLKSDTKDYFGVTKAAISIIYFITSNILGNTCFFLETTPSKTAVLLNNFVLYAFSNISFLFPKTIAFDDAFKISVTINT